jgi:hypothetical protein
MAEQPVFRSAGSSSPLPEWPTHTAGRRRPGRVRRTPGRQRRPGWPLRASREHRVSGVACEDEVPVPQRFADVAAETEDHFVKNVTAFVLEPVGSVEAGLQLVPHHFLRPSVNVLVRRALQVHQLDAIVALADQAIHGRSCSRSAPLRWVVLRIGCRTTRRGIRRSCRCGGPAGPTVWSPGPVHVPV